MSGRTRNILYTAVLVVLALSAVAGTAAIAYFGMRAYDTATILAVILCYIVCLFLVPLHTVVHEAGHALAGLMCGMRVISFSVGYFRFDMQNQFRVCVQHGAAVNGATALLPRSGKGVRGRMIFALLAGAGLDFIYAAVFFAVYFAVCAHPAVLFFTLFAPLAAYEGLMALYPIGMPAGPTDGKFACGLIKREAEAELSLRVMTAQGLLLKKTYAELPRELLFDTPVVREDCTAFLALLQLRYRALVCTGDAAAAEPLLRLNSLMSYLPEENRGEVAAELVCAGYLFDEIGDMGLVYAEEARGEGIKEVAQYARERTAENAEKARAAIGGVKMYGERKYLETLFSLLQKEKHPSETDAE